MTRKDAWESNDTAPNVVRAWRGLTERTVRGLQTIPDEAAVDPTVRIRLAAIAAAIVDLIGQEAVDSHEARVFAGLTEPEEGDPTVLVLRPKAEGQ